MSTWERIEIVRCDLCDQAACWRHPRGGLRCDTCPRPEEKLFMRENPGMSVAEYKSRKASRPDGGACRDCGGTTVPTGACSTCTTCGSTGGCG